MHVHWTKGGERWCMCMGPKEVKGGALTCMGPKEVKVGARALDQRR